MSTAPSGGTLLWTYLAAQRDALLAAAPGVRRGDPDAVHDMRIAVRRLRCTLRAFRPLGVPHTAPLAADLGWLGRRLGAVRDADVLSANLAAAIDAQNPALLGDPLVDRLDRLLARQTGAARSRLRRALRGDRYAELLGRLAATLAAPAPTMSYRQATARARAALDRADRRLDAALPAGARPPPADTRPPAHDTGAQTDDTQAQAGGTRPPPDDRWAQAGGTVTPHRGARPLAGGARHLAGGVRTGTRHLAGGVRTGTGTPPRGEPDREPDHEALHAARKAYKRARYSVEVLVPAAGTPARDLARRLKAIQDVLGDLHDARIATDVLHDAARRAQRDGEDTFGYGLLAAGFTATASDLLHRVPRARRRARKPAVRGWIDRG